MTESATIVRPVRGAMITARRLAMRNAEVKALVGAVLVLGALAGGTGGLSAQRAGLSATHGPTPRSDVPGGPGLRASVSYDLLTVFRLEAAAGRQWGREREPAPFCTGGGEGPASCVDEDGRRLATLTSGELAVLALTPAWRGIRLGAGITWGRYGFDVARESDETGIVVEPARGRERTLEARGWRVLAEYQPGDGPFSVHLSYSGFEPDFGACVLDAWSLCGEIPFRTLSLGTAYRLF